MTNEVCSQCRQEPVFLQPNRQPFWADARGKSHPLGEKCARERATSIILRRVEDLQGAYNYLAERLGENSRISGLTGTVQQQQTRIEDNFVRGFLVAAINDAGRLVPWFRLQGALILVEEGERKARSFTGSKRAADLINDLMEVKNEVKKRLPEDPEDPRSKWPQLSPTDRNRFDAESLLERANNLRTRAMGLEEEVKGEEEARALVSGVFGRLSFAPVAQSSSEPEVGEEDQLVNSDPDASAHRTDAT